MHRLCLEALGIAPDLELATPLTFASAELVRQRAPKVVTAAETLDVATQVPIPGGLFDTHVFGPGTVIDAPTLVDDDPVKPRSQFARIALGMPIVQPLVFEHVPHAIVERAASGPLECAALLDDAEAYWNVIGALELGGHGALVMRELAVLPPDLRPLRRLDDHRVATSSLNELYRRVVELNVRLARVVESNAPSAILASQRRELHEALQPLFAELRAACGGASGLAAALHELDRQPVGAELTGKLYRADSVLFALGITRESDLNAGLREAAA
ncbi:MAG TPA: hypothetical protein VIV11_34080 [Kofleriaceae bacterium]